MRIGQKVKVKETGVVGIIDKVDAYGNATYIKKIGTGEVISVIDKAVTVLSLIKWIIEQIKAMLNK